MPASWSLKLPRKLSAVTPCDDAPKPTYIRLHLVGNEVLTMR